MNNIITTTELRWSWQGNEVKVEMDQSGSGPVLLLLPALSSISTKNEMRPLMERLAAKFRVVAIDWPGFGTLPRPAMRWRPDALSAFLSHILQNAVIRPHGVVAAGHAASYVLHCLGDCPQAAERLVFVAPTWRGPLPTMAGRRRSFFETICRAVETPGIGPLLYRLNVNSFVVGKMVSGHVYSERGWLSGDRLAEKRHVINAPGARFGSAAFVTGTLDRVISREAFVGLAAKAAKPLLVVCGADTPKKSLAEMQALAQLPGVRLARLARGKLAVHEEFPDETAAAILPFLCGALA
jgi:pimeloyl-ACP methyl ester carboxylesterase